MFEKDKRGQVGIGTMIVFIAMVLVAAVAAAVLTQTSGFLQQRAMSTGRETTEQVSTGISVQQIEGRANGTTASAKIHELAIFLKTNTGGSEIDLSQTIVKLNDDSQQAVLRFQENGNMANIGEGGSPSKTGNVTVVNATKYGVTSKFDGDIVPAWGNTTESTFTLLVAQDYDGSALSAETPTLNKGDRVALLVNASQVFRDASDDADGIDVRTSISGEVVPEIGTSAIIDFTTPTAYTQRIIALQ